MAKKVRTTPSINYNDLYGSGFKIVVMAKNEEQKLMMQTITQNDITFVQGIAGTGKTFLAVTYGLQQLFKGKFEHIVITRPVVESGEKLGFLPGDIYEKIDPYMMPIFDAIYQLVPAESAVKMIAKSAHDPAPIRFMPLAYMRGSTYRNSFIICDEMQNSTPRQMRMLLTRLGEGSKMVICGDTRQTDVWGANGLTNSFDLLGGIEGIGFVTLSSSSVVRHPIIAKIEERYEEQMSKNNGSKASHHLRL